MLHRRYYRPLLAFLFLLLIGLGLGGSQLYRSYYLGALILFAMMTGALITRLINGIGIDDALSIAYYGVFQLYLVSFHFKNGYSAK